MNILIFIPCFTYGGTEKQAAILARYLHRKGHDVEVWGFPPPGSTSPLLNDLKADGISCRVLPKWPKLEWAFGRSGSLLHYAKQRFYSWPKQLKSFEKIIPSGGFDIVLPFTAIPCFVAVLFQNKICSRRIFWNHRGGYDDAGVFYSKYIIKRILRKNPHMLANSKAGAQFLTDTFGLVPEQVSIVPNIFQDDQVLSKIATQRIYRNRDGYVLQLVHVANLFPEKDIATVLDAMRLLRAANFPCHLHIGGFFPKQKDLSVFNESISRLGIDSIVTYHGALDKGQLREILQIADIGLLSSRSEGLPNSVMEYMYAALPVIGTDIPGMRELLGENNGRCFFPVGDSYSLTKIILGLGPDAESRMSMGQSNRARIVESFSPEKLLPKWDEVLASF